MNQCLPPLKGSPLDLRDYLRVIRKDWLIILVFVIIGSGLGVGFTHLTKKVYQASVQVFVATSTTDNAAQLQAGNTFIQDRVQSYTSIASIPAVTSVVISQLHLSLSEQQLASRISADAPQNK